MKISQSVKSEKPLALRWHSLDGVLAVLCEKDLKFASLNICSVTCSSFDDTVFFLLAAMKAFPILCVVMFLTGRIC